MAGESRHLGDAKTGLDRDEQKRVIAPAEPGALIGAASKRVDFGRVRNGTKGPREPLAGNGQHALDLRGMRREPRTPHSERRNGSPSAEDSGCGR